MSDSLIAFQPAIDEPSNIVPLVEEILVDHRQVEGDVLPLAARIGEAQIDVFDLLVLDQLQDALRAFLSAMVSVFPSRQLN